MDTNNVTVRNTITGMTAVIPARFIDNPAIVNPEIIKVVEPGAKPYVGAYTPKTVEEFDAIHPTEVDDDEEVEDYDLEDEE